MKGYREKRRGRRWTPPSALVHLVADGIVCDLHVRSGNARERSVAYELAISNESDARISCRLYGIDGNAHTREFGMLTIRPHSAGNSLFSVPLETGERRRLFVEVVGDGINLFAEALQPAALAKAHWPVVALASGCATGAAALALAYFIERPAIESLHVPTRTEPGLFQATYAARGDARVRYRATMPDGALVANGALSERSGEITFRIPAIAAGHVIRLALDATGPFGHTERGASFTVIARGSPTRPPVAAQAAHHTLPRVRGPGSTPGQSDVISIPDRVVAGTTFRVSIRRPLPGMRIEFLDAMEAVVANVAVAPNTETIQLSAPASPVVETYTLASTFERGNATATSIQPLRIYPR